MRFKVSRYGRLPDLPDQRDQPYAAPAEMVGATSRFFIYVADDSRASDFWTVRIVQ